MVKFDTFNQRALLKLDQQPDHYYQWDIKKFRDHFTRVLDEKKLDIPTV